MQIIQKPNASQTIPGAPVKFSDAIARPAWKDLIRRTLTDEKRVARFVANISAAVATNPALQACDAGTILSGALLGESLNLSPSATLGQFYLVPFKDRKRNRDVATFVLGYKGYIQLALRSGVYRKLNVLPIKEGELTKYDPLNEEVCVTLCEDDEVREALPTVGYFAMFEYLNGFRKVIYWSKAKMMAHADQYSPAFSAEQAAKLWRGEIPESEAWKYSSFWYKDFDGMACKTMIRQLIGKWGVMSLELQTAFEHDESFATPENATPMFIEEAPVEKAAEKPMNRADKVSKGDNTETVEEVVSAQESKGEETDDLFA